MIKIPMTSNFKRIIAILSASILLGGCAYNAVSEEPAMPEDKKLVIYTSHKANIYEPIIKEFEERSGIWVKVVTGGTNEILSKVSEEGSADADIMFGGGVDSLEVYKECFEPYVTSQEANLDSTYSSPEHAYTVFSKLPIVFIYNEKLVIQAGKPRTWAELLASSWKGKIAFADPNQSGSSYTALVTLIQATEAVHGDEEVIRKFVKNLDGDIYGGSGDIIDAVASGKKSIGVTLEETALKQMGKKADMGIIYPVDGTTTVPDGCAIFKDAPHKDNAKLFMEFIVGDDVQHLLEEELYRKSVRKDFKQSIDVKEIEYDLNYAIANREKILSLWDELTGEQ